MATRSDVTRRLAGLGRAGRRRLDTFSTQLGGKSWAWLLGGDYDSRPPAADEFHAMALPPFGRGVALLANAVAGTDWRAVRYNPDTGVSERIVDQPAVILDPDPTSTPWHYRWAAIEDLVLYGNHFALLGDLDHRTLRAGWLVPLPASDVWILTDPTRPGWYRWNIGGATLDPGDLLHISAGNKSGEILGRGVLAQYGDWLGGAVAAEEHTGSYFAGGALPPAVLQAPQILTQTQADELKAKWREMTSTREPVVLPSGYVLTPVVSNAETAQLVESRQWNAAAVAMMLGIPSYKLGLAGPSMTYQNIESADIEFVRDSVDRYGHPLSEAFTKWLMPRGTTVAWDYAGRMRADTSTTATVLTTYTNAGVLTMDEARAMLGRPPLEDEPPHGNGPADDLPDPPADDLPADGADGRVTNDDGTDQTGDIAP